MHNSCSEKNITRVRSITSGNADRYIAKETAHLTAGERSLLGYLKTFIDWEKRQEGIVKSIKLKISKMAELQGVSKATIKRRLAGLKNAGEIVVSENFTDNGRQLPSSYTFPKMTAWLKTLTVSDVVEAYTVRDDEKSDESQSQGGGLKSDTPIKQGSYSKKNTYMRFLKKEDFLSITGSVRYVPRIAGIIRKMRPGVDPDIIFRYFKEWISSEEFILQSGKTFIGLLFQFSRWCKIPYFEGFIDKQKKKNPKAPVNHSSCEPKGEDVISRIRKRLFIHDAAMYRNWFYEAGFSISESDLTFRGKSQFATNHVKTHFDQLLSHMAGAEGLRIRFT